MILKYLVRLGLSLDEARIYLELLKGPSSHLELSRATGVNRTKVYRIADDLELKSLISTITDDQGTRLVASDPESLEVSIVNKEQEAQNLREVYKQVAPSLDAVARSGLEGSKTFMVQTYDGVDGFKQMLWHELKARREVLIFGSGTLEKLVENKNWAERHRAKTVEEGIDVRELMNPGEKPADFTKNQEFMDRYFIKYIPKDVLSMENQVVIYNDTVATFSWRNDEKVGVEVLNAANAEMMRQVFEQYWAKATF